MILVVCLVDNTVGPTWRDAVRNSQGNSTERCALWLHGLWCQQQRTGSVSGELFHLLAFTYLLTFLSLSLFVLTYLEVHLLVVPVIVSEMSW